MVTGNENTVLSELHKTVYATGLKLHFKLLRLNYIYLQHCLHKYLFTPENIVGFLLCEKYIIRGQSVL